MKKIFKIDFNSQKGQALVTLIFFTLIGLTIATAAIVIAISNTINSGKFQSGNLTFTEAESGAESAYIQLLRNPNYSGETMTINGTEVTVTVSGSNPIFINSVASSGAFLRQVQVELQYQNGKYSVQSWKEIF